MILVKNHLHVTLNVPSVINVVLTNLVDVFHHVANADHLIPVDAHQCHVLNL
jgi:hypothetical protein